MNQKNAFTLAEVLITLGIIGVVAAMTMPTLLNSTQGIQYKTAFKKSLSVISQAAVVNYALEDYDFSDCNAQKPIKDVLAARMNVVNKAPTAWTNFATKGTIYIFNDGTAFTFPAGPCSNAAPCDALIDVNGPKGPNILTSSAADPKDIYKVKITSQGVEPGDQIAKDILYAVDKKKASDTKK